LKTDGSCNILHWQLLDSHTIYTIFKTSVHHASAKIS
jgi:hypothetical protein